MKPLAGILPKSHVCNFIWLLALPHPHSPAYRSSFVLRFDSSYNLHDIRQLSGPAVTLTIQGFGQPGRLPAGLVLSSPWPLVKTTILRKSRAGGRTSSEKAVITRASDEHYIFSIPTPVLEEIMRGELTGPYLHSACDVG